MWHGLSLCTTTTEVARPFGFQKGGHLDSLRREVVPYKSWRDACATWLLLFPNVADAPDRVAAVIADQQ